MSYVAVFFVTAALAVISFRGRSVPFIVFTTFPYLILIRILFWWMSGDDPVAMRISHPYSYLIMLAIHSVVAGIFIRRFIDSWIKGDFEDFFRD